MKTIIVETNKEKVIKDVLLLEKISEFFFFLKKELNTGNLSDYLINEFYFIHDKELTGVFLYKINNKIIAFEEKRAEDIPYLKPFDSWAAYDLTIWIKENFYEFERIMKLKVFC